MPPRAIYGGKQRKLVIAFDIGTTYSGISYSVLDPGQVPEIKPVTRFPAHEHVSGASKIPTLIYYDRKGKVRAVGAEAMREGVFELAEEEHWVKAEWFKLHLRSKVGAGKTVREIPPLPGGKRVVEVFADFLSYLHECVASYIKDTHANGIDFWASVKGSGNIDYVLSHPNGWEGAQQSEMRKAVVLAGLISDNESGHDRLSFVTEGEASLHFSVDNGLPESAMKNGDGVVIVDAGGGTIDISSYSRDIKSRRSTFGEIAAPQCHFHGSVFITILARAFLKNFLSDSPFHDDLEYIVRCFDKSTKLRFRNTNEPQYIKFGSTRDNDANCNIRFGQMKLSGSDVALFFQPSVDCIVNAVRDQKKCAQKPISHVILVGGFASSDWLFNSVQEELKHEGLNVIRPENHVNKAVSDGAISFYLDHIVRTRVSKFTYGILYSRRFDASKADHQERSARKYMCVTGKEYIKGAFSSILFRNTQVSETKEFKKSYNLNRESKSKFKNTHTSIWCYRGQLSNPAWRNLDHNNFTKLCQIDIDLLNLPMSSHTNRSGDKTYMRVEYEVVLQFGLTELKAQIAWEENGVEKRSPAQIIYDPDTTDD